MGYNNETDGVFDIRKESVIVADIVADALMYPKLISKENSDKASEIAAEKFLLFRNGQVSSGDEHAVKFESRNLAKIITDAFIAAEIVNQADAERVFEIAEEEILVRRAMESL